MLTSPSSPSPPSPRRRPRHAATFATTVAILVAACKEKPAPPQAPPPSPTAPADRLAPGELVEGPDKAFALVLPRDVRILRAFPGIVHAAARTASLDQVSKYVQARVRDGQLVTRGQEVRFLNVHPVSQPDQELVVELKPTSFDVGTCELLVRDATLPKLAPGVTQDEIRRDAGVTADGKLVDRLRLE